MKLSEAYAYGRKTLENAKIADAQVDSWQLLEYVCGCDKSYYYLHMEEPLTEEQEAQYKACIQKRASHIPLQHITGIAYFMGLEFTVNEHVLIPRFDTEVLVEEVLKRIKGQERILDMCTGSGCILLSLLHERPMCTGTGADISEKALEVARKNAAALDLNPTFIQTDLYEHICEKYDIIVSNPPYIKTCEIAALEEEVRLHDPMLALDGMADGLYFYREIVKRSHEFLTEGGFLCFEIGYDQGADVLTMMEAQGYENVTIVKDLAGLDRVVIGGKPCLTN